MICRWVKRVALVCRPISTFSASVSRNLGTTPDTPLGGMLAHQFGEDLLGVVPLQQAGNIDRLGRLVQARARRSHLDAPDHVAADHRQEGHRTGADVGTELLLEYLQQVAFREVHLEDRVQDVIPDVGFPPHTHGQGDEVVRGRARKRTSSRIAPALTAKLIQRAGRPHLDKLKLHAQRGQHGQQLARAELGQLPTLKSGQRLLRYARAGGDLPLLQAQGAASCGDCFAQFQDRLHLIYMSNNVWQTPFFDIYV